MSKTHDVEVVKTTAILGSGGWYQAHCKTCGWWAPKSYATSSLAERDADYHKEDSKP